MSAKSPSRTYETDGWYRCDYCRGWLCTDPEDRDGGPVPHDHADDSPESSLTAELRYARRADY